MICSKTKLGSELDKIKQLLIENGYPADVLLSCINQKVANFAAEKTFGPEKCPVYLKLPWIGNVSSKFENQIINVAKMPPGFVLKICPLMLDLNLNHMLISIV